MKILVADKLPSQYIDELKAEGNDVVFEPKLGEADIVEAAKDVDAIVVRSTKVNADAINNAANLKLVIRAGAGFNNINTDAANEKGVSVANCPGKNSIAVAELAVGLIVSLDRKIPSNVADFNNNKWNKAEYSKAEGLYGKKMAIVGFGNIGKEVAKRAMAFGIKVYAKDIFPITMENVTVFESLEETLPEMDIISFHLPATPETKGMVNASVFSLLKEGTMLINTSRAEIINEDDLLKAVEEKGLLVGLDVFNGEPEGKTGDVSSKLQNNPNIYVTHHIGASTNQAQLAVAEEVVRIVSKYNKEGVVDNLVNKPQK